jgi:hypothetical protein
MHGGFVAAARFLAGSFSIRPLLIQTDAQPTGAFVDKELTLRYCIKIATKENRRMKWRRAHPQR